jgi:hypothetical protein
MSKHFLKISKEVRNMWDIIKNILKVILAFIIGLVVCALIMAIWAVAFIWPLFIPIISFLCIFGLLLYYMFN